jgi:hypothetical protein
MPRKDVGRKLINVSSRYHITIPQFMACSLLLFYLLNNLFNFTSERIYTSGKFEGLSKVRRIAFPVAVIKQRASQTYGPFQHKRLQDQ